MFNCSLQQMGQGRRDAWHSKLMLEDDAERVLGMLLDSTINV